MEILKALGIENDWQLILVLSVLLAHMRVMWARTKTANDNLEKFGRVADVLLAVDPHAKMPNTPHVLSLIEKFHEMLADLEDMDAKMDRILEHLNVPGPGMAKRRIGHE